MKNSSSSINTDSMAGKYLTFMVSDVCYAIAISHVTEIIEVHEMTPVPRTPSYIQGLTNLRGTITPIIDMRLRFGKEKTPYTERSCIIVMSVDGMSLGFIVDGVDEVCDVANENIQPPPRLPNDKSSQFVSGIGNIDGKIFQLLDVDMVFELGEV